MNKKRKSILLIIALTMLLSLSACGKKEDLIDTEDDNAEKAPVASVVQIDLNKKPDTGLKLTPLDIDNSANYVKSYYVNNLNNNLKLVYDEIFQSIERTNDKYVPTTNLRISEMVRIMNIMIIDEPILFHLKDSYSYKTNDKGFVSEINFEYYMDGDDYNATKTDIIKKLSVHRDNTDVNLLEKIYDTVTLRQIIPYDKSFEKNKEYMDTLSSNITNDVDFEKYEFEEIGKTILSYGLNNVATEMSVAKWVNLSSRYYGVPSMIVVGERLDKTIDGANKYDKDIDNIVEVSKTNVKINQEKLNMWNLVSFDNHWFHIDTLYYNNFKNKLNDEDKTNIKNEDTKDALLNTMRFGFGLTDEQISLTKLFFINEDILGISGMAYSNDFYGIEDRKNVKYLKSTPTNAVERKVKDMLIETTETRSSHIVLAFENIDNFNYVDITIDLIMTDLIHNGFLPFERYSVESDVDNMIIIIHDIIRK